MLIEMPVASASSATVAPRCCRKVPCQLPRAVWVRAVHGGVPGSRSLAENAGSSTLPGHRFQVTSRLAMLGSEIRRDLWWYSTTCALTVPTAGYMTLSRLVSFTSTPSTTVMTPS